MKLLCSEIVVMNLLGSVYVATHYTSHILKQKVYKKWLPSVEAIMFSMSSNY